MNNIRRGRRAYYSWDKSKEQFTVLEIGQETCTFVWDNGIPGMSNLKSIVFVDEVETPLVGRQKSAKSK